MLSGVNKRMNEQWDPSKSYMIEFRGKDETYGRPVEGTKTAERAQKAIKHINKQIINLLIVIRRIGDKDPETNLTSITFGKLFEWYEPISDNLVGLLIRARRWRLVDFPGEMLYQRQDDNVVIKLLVTEDDFVVEKTASINSSQRDHEADQSTETETNNNNYESKLNVTLSQPSSNSNNNPEERRTAGFKTGHRAW